MCSLESVAECLQLPSVLFLEFGNLAGQCDDQDAVGVGRLVGDGLAASAAQMFDPFAQFGMVVEEGVRDACFALHGLERDRFAGF